MFKLSSIILALLLSINVPAQSPHGDKFSIKCDVCHNPEGWSIKIKSNSFDHSTTDFKLDGQHQTAECRKCHTDLVFSKAKKTCLSCHKDLHQQTVGQDCERCHTPRSWIVSNINEIHRQSRFPLIGQHAQTDCYQCHKSASLLRFDPMGAECVDCHLNDYTSTTNPVHVASSFPKNCSFCHNEKVWQPAKFDHTASTVFPLSGGHSGIECIRCHANGYTGTSSDCVSCHLTKYNATTNPPHSTANFPTDCKSCHGTTTWTPAAFNHDTQFFPINSGKHRGGWTLCSDCHTSPANYAVFSCLLCHEHNKSSMDSEHRGENGYVYNSTNCLSCHPKGSSD